MTLKTNVLNEILEPEAMMKLGTVIPYLKKVQKMYESQNTPLELC